MTAQEIADRLGGQVPPLSDKTKARLEEAAKWRADMEAKIQAMPEPERSKQWELYQKRMAKWNNW